ncbi:alkanesulfonate monooxygenase SsuD/methylene tetrahydromethanopterin reductase-like flavin-dependent oxidoreductase (luciferase family) [Actinoplanes lutulentus]|uniref:Luciferase-like monooxygenase n=1 Tax=Actinoplanes lutulentus TaxID=1287878 RepID=A0A327ZEG3_9ACTN|nr:LLM class flavin-dependent oxidoreductase [Actinoplanes lutulentus]MBB2942698.1 alkanesulfonate monooxygenase SsuD/methylene tetrahydromethanopterin reductase-like flavin-dependent oxidoreductase (luciferase family) [Actinoplanes lutulentus]RAK38279.1 luciferase-like monooxygenase [Actinoplanes lutulentus]
MSLHLALEVDGDGADVAALTAHVTAAEAAGFALVTIADSPLPPADGSVRIEAGVRAAYLSRRTTRIGLAPTLHASVTEPFHLATQLASLDHASLGRAAWVVGAESSAAAAATVGEPVLTGSDLRREIADVIDVARQLWDSWEDDAVIRDRATSRFLDPDRVHHVNFTGARFTVSGPLITPRPPQGQVVVIGADTLGVTSRLDIALVDTADTAAGLGELTERTALARADGAALVFADLPSADASLLRHLDGVVDGVRIRVADIPLVTDLLKTRPPAGPTLRDTLGLPRPANQFAVAG